MSATVWIFDRLIGEEESSKTKRKD